MRALFLAMSMAALAGAGCNATTARIAAVPELPSAPTPEFARRFAPTLPNGAFDTKGWAFVQFAARYDIASPRSSKPLDGYVLSVGFCLPEQPCRFRMSVLTFQESIEPIATPAAMRYVLERSDGVRLEGYAQTSRADLAFAYYRYDGHAWKLLRDADAMTEHEFVHATWNYVAMQ